MILHICTKDDWGHAVKAGVYEADTLVIQGYIHCSTPEQVAKVANHKFKGESSLILLIIDDQKVKPEIKYEDPGNGKLYPHIYGPLNTDAVLKTVDFPPGQNGEFELPNLQ